MASDTYEKLALDTLKKKGFRITMPRVMVVRALAAADTALDAYAIHGKVVKEGGRIDVVSVYRITASLIECGLAYKVGTGYFRREAGSGILAFKGHSITEAKPNPHLLELVSAIAGELGLDADSFQLEIQGVA